MCVHNIACKRQHKHRPHTRRGECHPREEGDARREEGTLHLHALSRMAAACCCIVLAVVKKEVIGNASAQEQVLASPDRPFSAFGARDQREGNVALEEVAELGCPQCPRINETPLIEPLVCKKIAHEKPPPPPPFFPYNTIA